MIVIQSTELVAVHVQLDPVMTDTLALMKPLNGTELLVGDTVKTQLLAAWLTVTVFPATAIVPVRAAAVEFAATA